MSGIKGIREVDLTKVEKNSFVKHVADCVILTKNNQLLLQQRPLNWESQPGSLTTFGGHIEDNETVIEPSAKDGQKFVVMLYAKVVPCFLYFLFLKCSLSRF